MPPAAPSAAAPNASASPSSLDPIKVAAYKEVFEEFDLDRSGTINVGELGDTMRKLSGGLPVRDAEIEAIMRDLDADKSGDIGFDEFCKMMAARSDPEEEMRAAFSAFDVDGSGAISAAEVRSGLPVPRPPAHLLHPPPAPTPAPAVRAQAKQLLRNLDIEISDVDADELIAVADTGELPPATTPPIVARVATTLPRRAATSVCLSAKALSTTFPCLPAVVSADGSGELEFSEFQIMLQSNSSAVVRAAWLGASLHAVAAVNHLPTSAAHGVGRCHVITIRTTLASPPLLPPLSPAVVAPHSPRRPRPLLPPPPQTPRPAQPPRPPSAPWPHTRNHLSGGQGTESRADGGRRVEDEATGTCATWTGLAP